MTDLEKLKAKLEPYKNTLVLDFYNVVRLVDVEDGEDDFYWVYEGNKREIYRASCCCGWFPLKGVMADEDYKYLRNIWNLNHENRVD